MNSTPRSDSHEWDFTQNMETVFQNRLSEEKNFYFREDFEQVLEELDRLPRDAKAFALQPLIKMCGLYGLKVEDVLDNRSLLNEVPKITDALPTFFHDLYKNCPSPSDYMKRIVHNLSPEYSADPVRVAILKKFIEGCGLHCATYNLKKIAELILKKASEADRKEYKKAKDDKVKIAILLKYADDTLFDDNIINPKLSSADTVDLLAKRIQQCMKDGGLRDKERNEETVVSDAALCAETEAMLKEWCVSHKLPYDEEKKAVDRLCIALKNADFSDNTFDEVAKAVERDISEQLKNLLYKKSNGKEARVYELYDESRKSRLKTLRKPVELLRLCDELSRGAFRTNGATRLFLYHFAIVFGMTIKLKDTDIFDHDSNIVKNLFEDYYNDNLVRFINRAYSDPQYAAKEENEPSGEGINFKNFIEVIYIYYLYRTDLKLTPGERIDNAEKTVKACIDEAKKQAKNSSKSGEPSVPNENLLYTEDYRKKYIEKIIDLPESDLPVHIPKYYTVISPNNATGAKIQISSDENTAFKNILEIFELIDTNMPSAIPFINFDELIKKKRKSKVSNDTEDDIFDSYCDSDSELFTDEAEDSPFDFYDDSEARSKLLSEHIDDYRGLESSFDADLELAELLKSKYSSDTDFTRMVDYLEKRLTEKPNIFGKERLSFLTKLLYILYHETDAATSLESEKLKNKLIKSHSIVNGSMITEGAEQLCGIGIDIKKETKSGKSRYKLVSRSYKDTELSELMKLLNAPSYSLKEARIGELLSKKLNIDKRISRTQLITAYAALYPILIELEDEGDDEFENEYDYRNEYYTPSFYHVMEDFSQKINRYLSESRYQMISTKNIFDLYIIMHVYFTILNTSF